MANVLNYCILGIMILGIMKVGADEKNPDMAVHGGLVQAMGSYHLELVIRDQYLDLYISDDKGKAKSTDNITVNASVVDENGKQAIRFKPATGNQLVARGDFSSDEVYVVVLEMTSPYSDRDTVVFIKEASAAGEESITGQVMKIALEATKTVGRANVVRS
jgi:hypothetical protein